MAGMKRKGIAAASVLLMVMLLGLAACENDLLSYLFKNLFYSDWKITSWNAPEPVVANYTHEQGSSFRNGFPLNMSMGSNGKIHLIGWRVSGPPHEWLYTVRQPGEAIFQQSYTSVASISNPGSIGVMPGIDLISDDVPMIAFADESGVLYFQDYNTLTGWGSPEALYTAAADITNTFVFFLSTDFRPHLFYVSAGKLYHTVRTGSGAINPNPPEVYIDDVASVAARRQGPGEVHFLYTDSVKQNLYHRRFTGTSPTTIWSAGDSSLGIGEIALTFDPDNSLHVCFGTNKPTDMLNTAFYVLHYLSNSSGAWEEKHSITGNSTSGPLVLFFPPSIAISTDKYGNDHLHIAYTEYKPPGNFYIWYAYYDESGWHKSGESLDTTHTNSFWTFPVLGVDAQGIVHIIYSWTQTELDRSMMYIRGTPGESQE